MPAQSPHAIWISALFLLLLACSASDSGTDPGDGAAVDFEEIADVLPNPFKGFVPWIGVENPVYDTRMHYKTFEWRDIEPQEGQYNWSYLERNWGVFHTGGKRVGFRISAATPGSGNAHDIPDWLADAGVPLREYHIDGHTGLAPDWDDPRFLAAHANLLAALGARYNGDPRVAWIDIGSYGFWGEWHVYLNDSLAATQASRQTIIDHYFAAFPDKHLVIAFDDDFATGYVTNRGGGIRNDCLGTAASNDWYLSSLNGIDPTLNERVWKTAIITGEFCGSTAGAIAGTTERFELNLDFIRQTHWSYIGTAGGAIPPQDEAHRRNLDRLHKTLGYRFVLRNFDHPGSAASGSRWTATLEVENVGIAPFYYPWPLVLYLIDGDGTVAHQAALPTDIRTWLPGRHSVAIVLDLPPDLPSGGYDIRIAIHDADSDEPGVMFANSTGDADLRYRIGRLTVE